MNNSAFCRGKWSVCPTVNLELSNFQVDGIYDNPLELLDIKPEFSDDEGLNDSKTEPKVKLHEKQNQEGCFWAK